jgi:hypothetical protein
MDMLRSQHSLCTVESCLITHINCLCLGPTLDCVYNLKRNPKHNHLIRHRNLITGFFPNFILTLESVITLVARLLMSPVAQKLSACVQDIFTSRTYALSWILLRTEIVSCCSPIHAFYDNEVPNRLWEDRLVTKIRDGGSVYERKHERCRRVLTDGSFRNFEEG